MGWLPDDFFIGHPGPPERRPRRPIGQGDVFESVPIAIRAGLENGQLRTSGAIDTVIVVASSCGMRKDAGQLNDLVHVAPVKRLESLARGWGEPWSGFLAVLPLPGLTHGGTSDAVAANLARIGLCSATNLTVERRLASVSLSGMETLKSRLSTYFTRAQIAPSLFAVGAHEEWHELDLWERWVTLRGHEDGFQAWLDEVNPNFVPNSRRETLYDDLVGISEQLEVEAVAR